MSLDPYHRTHNINKSNLIKPLKRIDETFSDPEDQDDNSNGKNKSFSDTFAEILEESDDDIDTLN